MGQSIAHKGDEVLPRGKSKSQFVGPEICGKTLGVIGLGAVGAKVAQAAVALGMTVYGYDPYLSVDAAWRMATEVRHAKDIDTILKNSDYITIHAVYGFHPPHALRRQPLQDEKGVRIINLARAELVCDDDMIKALDDGQVASTSQTSPTAKRWGPKVIAIPHLGASTPESEDNCAYMAAKEVIEYIENGNISNSVNMPSAYLPRTEDPRLCVIHKNGPDMIAKITTVVSGAGLNIENMINAGTKGRAFAYTMIDVPSVAPGLKIKLRLRRWCASVQSDKPSL